MLKRGIVLGGGGSRGSYQIGVWEALRELGIDYQIVTGTSIGALNGALMVQNDFEAAKSMWENIRYDSVLGSVSEGDFESLEGASKIFKSFLRDAVSKGALDIGPLENLVRTHLKEDVVRSSPIEFGLVTVEFPTIKEVELTKEEIPEGMMAEYLLASAACFPAFETRQIKNSKYIDGGYRNNLPIDMAVALGANEIIAVELKSIGFIPKFQAGNVPVRYIRSYWNLGLFLNFDTPRILRNMRLGYLDTMRSYGKIEGVAYAFPLGSSQANYEAMGPVLQEMGAYLDFDVSRQARNPMEKLVKLRLSRHLKDGKRLRFDSPRVVQRAAEIAGEVLSLPPARMYEWEEFNTQLMQQMDQLERVSVEKLETLVRTVRDARSAAGLTEEIKSLDVRQIAALFCDWIDEAWNGGKNYLWLAAAAAPKEFIAAAYLYGLHLRRQGVMGKSMVTLETRQVVLKPLTIRDLNRVHQLASDPEVAKNMRFSVHKSLEETRQMVEEYLTGAKDGSKFPFTVWAKEDGSFVGVFVIKGDHLEERPGEYEMTAFFGKNSWGHGYLTEILGAAADFVFTKLDGVCLRGYALERTIGSLKALHRNGFVLEREIFHEGMPCKLQVHKMDRSLYEELHGHAAEAADK